MSGAIVLTFPGGPDALIYRMIGFVAISGFVNSVNLPPLHLGNENT